MNRILITLLLVLTSASLGARETTKLTAMEQFAEQKAVILEDLKSGKVYKEITHHSAKLVTDALGRMSEMLDGVETVEQLNPDQKTALFNDQELVNTVLTMAENDSRQLCTRRHRVGTHFKTTDCETVAQRRERQERDRQELERIRDMIGSMPGGG